MEFNEDFAVKMGRCVGLVYYRKPKNLELLGTFNFIFLTIFETKMSGRPF